VYYVLLVSSAHDISVQNKRQTITLKDVIQALEEVELPHFQEPIELCLQGTE
jgi:hypothetical protein